MPITQEQFVALVNFAGERNEARRAAELAAAQVLAQKFVGETQYVKHHESLPEDGLFLISNPSDYYLFSVHEVKPRRVGHTEYVGVDKATGKVSNIGQHGE